MAICRKLLGLSSLAQHRCVSVRAFSCVCRVRVSEALIAGTPRRKSLSCFVPLVLLAHSPLSEQATAVSLLVGTTLWLIQRSGRAIAPAAPKDRSRKKKKSRNPRGSSRAAVSGSTPVTGSGSAQSAGCVLCSRN